MNEDHHDTLVAWPVVLPNGKPATLWLPPGVSPPAGYGVDLKRIDGATGVYDIELTPVQP